MLARNTYNQSQHLGAEAGLPQFKTAQGHIAHKTVQQKTKTENSRKNKEANKNQARFGGPSLISALWR